MCAFLVLLFTAYEKGHQRPALSVYTFQMPESCHSQPCSPSGVSSCGDTTPVVSPQAVYASSMMDSISTTTCSPYARPPLPQRGSSLERPHIPGKMANISCNGGARESFHNSGEFAEISHLIEINYGRARNSKKKSRESMENILTDTSLAAFKKVLLDISATMRGNTNNVELMRVYLRRT